MPMTTFSSAGGNLSCRAAQVAPSVLVNLIFWFRLNLLARFHYTSSNSFPVWCVFSKMHASVSSSNLEDMLVIETVNFDKCSPTQNISMINAGPSRVWNVQRKKVLSTPYSGILRFIPTVQSELHFFCKFYIAIRYFIHGSHCWQRNQVQGTLFGTRLVIPISILRLNPIFCSL